MKETIGSKIRRQRGFTLIELIIVITIVGILAAVALPRFINAQVDARIAKAQAMYGAIKSAGSLAKARCELDLARAGTVDMDGTAVAMVNKYPAATAAGIDAAAQLSVTEGLTIAGAAPRTFDIVGATTAANCRISYTAAAVGAAPVITLVTTGC